MLLLWPLILLVCNMSNARSKIFARVGSLHSNESNSLSCFEMDKKNWLQCYLFNVDRNWNLSLLLCLSWLEASLTWRWISSSRNQRASSAWWSSWTIASPHVRRRCGASSPPSSRRVSATCRHAPKWGSSSKCWIASPQLTAWLQVETLTVVLIVRFWGEQHRPGISVDFYKCSYMVYKIIIALVMVHANRDHC